MNRPKILVTNTDENFLNQLRKISPQADFEAFFASSDENIDPILKKKNPDLIITCSMEKDTQQSILLVRNMRRFSQNIPILFITEKSSEQLAIDAFRAGVNDYYKIPFSTNSLRASLNRFLKNSDTPGKSLGLSRNDQKIIGKSLKIKEIKNYIERVAAADSTVLITGETGTGKELAAEMIHLKSHRKNKPLIRVNCSALPENLVESELFGYEQGAFTGAVAPQKGKLMAANGGDIFFDEIGDMNGYAQAKILRSIEYKEVFPLGSNHSVPVDFRIMAATNRNPEELMEEGKFRKDLYYRLNVARVHMPPLRERMQDIPDLVVFAIKNLNHKFKRNVQGLTNDAMDLLLQYDWPGNVRELMNLLEAAFIDLPQNAISHADLPKMFRKHLHSSNQIPMDEKRKILATLLETKWNKSSAAQKLNWSRMTLYRKMTKYKISENGKPAR
jgi:DNA-binding NtrC family response regulator